MGEEIQDQAPDSQFSIEPAGWRDLNSLRYLERACFPKDAWPLFDLIGVLTFPSVARLKAVKDEKLIGFVAADIRPFENVAWIATLAVLPEFQGRGIGAALLQACEDRLRVMRVRLSVRASNEPAIRLYRSHGYQQTGIWQRYYQDGEDAIVMEKIR